MNVDIVAEKAGPHSPDLWIAKIRRNGEEVSGFSAYGLSRMEALNRIADGLRGLAMHAEALAITGDDE